MTSTIQRLDELIAANPLPRGHSLNTPIPEEGEYPSAGCSWVYLLYNIPEEERDGDVGWERPIRPHPPSWCFCSALEDMTCLDEECGEGSDEARAIWTASEAIECFDANPTQGEAEVIHACLTLGIDVAEWV